MPRSISTLLLLVLSFTQFGIHFRVRLLTPRAPAPVTAEMQTGDGLHTTTFKMPEGTIRVHFPDDTAAGDTISGTVLPDPVGNTPAEKEANYGELNGYVIEVEKQTARPEEKSHRWKIPPELPKGGIFITLRDPRRNIVAQSPLPVDPVPALHYPQQTARDFELPSLGAPGKPATVRGPFNGDLSSTVARIGSIETVLLAESPRKLVFQTPSNVTGTSSIEIRKGDLTVSGPFRSLGVILKATNYNLLRGQSATLTVTVVGLLGFNDPVYLTLTNRTPDVVQVQGGVVQRFEIEPDQVRLVSSYEKTLTLTGVQPGRFNITALATPPPSRQFDMQRTVNRSLANWQRTNGILITPDAEKLIQSSVLEGRRQLDEFMRLQQEYHSDSVSLLEALLQHYCFDLRDRKPRTRIGAISIPSAIGVARFSNLLLSQPSGAQGRIDGSDVKKYSFKNFLTNLLKWLSPSQPVGYLYLSSTPDKQMITIDNHHGGQDYFTNRRFVVNTGDHTVVILSCRQTIRVGANQLETMVCKF